MAVLKYLYLGVGIILYVVLNVLSYTLETFNGDLATKILFSFVSFVLLVFDYITILKTEMILKKPFSKLTTYTKIMLYLGVLVIPLISLYYQS